MKKLIWPLTITLLTVATLLGGSGCKQEGCTDPNALNYDPEATESNGDCDYPQLSFSVQPVVDGEALVMDQDYVINGTTVRFETVNFYLQDFRLMDMDGTMTEAIDTILLSTPANRDFELGELSAGHKHMLTFQIGLDSATNHLTDPSIRESSDPLAFQSPSMHWTWDNGYIFMRVDGKVDTDGDLMVDNTLTFHLGKLPNRKQVSLMLHSNATEKDFEVAATFDLATFFTGINLKEEFFTKTGNAPVLAAKAADNIPAAFALP
ncbi:MAG: MbnP family protein [Bacteroidota bacterium]